MPRGPAKKTKTEATSHQPPATSHQPPATSHQPPATSHQPPATSHQSLESKLWATADKLRDHLDAADYKHVVLGLIFLKYISGRFAQRHELCSGFPRHIVVKFS